MSPAPLLEDRPLEPEFVETLRRIFEEKIAFNRILGLRVIDVTGSRARGGIAMRDELVGHYASIRVHGGVISACLDAIAGLAVMGAIGAAHRDESVPQRLARFGRLGTIDLRVDYMRPATGAEFGLRAEVLRMGSRVATTRMEFTAGDGTLLSVGAAAYIVS